MRFFSRSLFGLFLLTLTAGLVGLAGNAIIPILTAKEDADDRRGGARERVFAVNVFEVEPAAIAPQITTFGEVISGRILQLRAAAPGALVKMSPNFREGATVFKNEVLFQTDPAAATAALRVAETELAEARAELQEATDALLLSEDELAAAQGQLVLREQALERQRSLLARRVGTEAAVETAELAVSSANQSVLTKRQTVANAVSRINRAEINLSRRQINRDEADRKLKDTTVVAEFDGVLSGVTGFLGGLVSQNEQLAELIDPNALEISFRISSEQYANLTNGSDLLPSVPVTAEFTGLPEPLNASIQRVGAAVGEGKTGREIFAKIDPKPAQGLRPGDFLSVIVEEPVIEGAALIPASAINSSGEVLVVGEENRLIAVNVPILRRQGDLVLVAAAQIANKALVEKRAPQLGTGIKVEPRSKMGGEVLEEQKLVSLNEKQKAEFTAAVEANQRMPKDVKARVLARIATGKLPQENFDRMERMASRSRNTTDSSAPDEDLVKVTPEMQAKMTAFVEANENIPATFKERVLESLAKGEVPREMYDRITSRMGG